MIFPLFPVFLCLRYLCLHYRYHSGKKQWLNFIKTGFFLVHLPQSFIFISYLFQNNFISFLYAIPHIFIFLHSVVLLIPSSSAVFSRFPLYFFSAARIRRSSSGSSSNAPSPGGFRPGAQSGTEGSGYNSPSSLFTVFSSMERFPAVKISLSQKLST